MYPLYCYGGYPVPIKAGRFEVVQIRATIEDMSLDSRLRLIDDNGITDEKFGRILPDGMDQDTAICDLQGKANTQGELTFDCFEPLKVRNGISTSYTTNIVAGSLFVYVR